MVNGLQDLFRLTARAGDTFVLSGTCAIGKTRRHGLAEISLRSGKLLPFDPALPVCSNGYDISALTASPSVLYVAYASANEVNVVSLDLRTGARVPGFD